MGRGFIELYDDDGFRYFVNIDKIVNVSVDNNSARATLRG